MNIFKAFKKTSQRLIIAVICAFLFSNGMLAQAAETLSDPRVVEDSSMANSRIRITWTCVWLGSYPQTEIVDKEESCGTYGTDFETTSIWDDGQSDCIIDSELYNKLKNATDWDQNGDIIIDGTKYRRIQKSDANYYEEDSDNYFRWSNGDTYHYFRFEPIKWRVLHVDGNQALLLSDKVLDVKPYNTSECSITWENCTLRKWLNSNFMNDAFSSEEQSAIKETLLDNSTTSENASTLGGNDTIDKIYLLAAYDLYNTDNAESYGFLRKNISFAAEKSAEGTTFAKAMGTYNNTEGKDIWKKKCDWWLRSVGNTSTKACWVFDSGDVAGNGTVTQKTFGVRPSLTLDLTSSAWSGACAVISDDTDFEEHSWNDGGITEEATCGKAGVKTYTCSNCKETKTEAIPATGHSWGTGVITKKATCVTAGVKTYTCSNCGKTKTEAIPATGQHKAVKDKAVAATVFATGKTAGSHCSVCGKVITAQKTVAKLKPTIKLSAAKKTLKTKKSYTMVISKLAKGDSIKSVKSSKTSYVSVKKISTTKYKITAKKKGKAYVTVTLKSKKTAKCLITVK